MVFTGSALAGSASAFSSSAKPFLNDLMPLAKSPIRSEILPRPPNSNSPTARTRIQCQTLIEPILRILRADGPHGPLRPHGPSGIKMTLGPRGDKNKDLASAPTASL